MSAARWEVVLSAVIAVALLYWVMVAWWSRIIANDITCGQAVVNRDWFNTTWSQKSRGDRAKTVIACFVIGLIGLAVVAGMLWIAALLADAEDYRSIEHHQCLKGATNGLEIERCR